MNIISRKILSVTFQNRLHRIIWIILFLCPVILAVFYGAAKVTTNFEYDFRNYHLYVADAFWRGRETQDLFAAGMMSYMNPLLDLPCYFLFYLWNTPHLGAAFFGLIQGLTVLVIAGISYFSLPSFQNKGNLSTICLFLGIAGGFSSLQLREEISGFGDNITGLLILTSIFLIVMMWKQNFDRKKIILFWSISGFLAGCSAGLKLSNVFYVIALAAAVFFTVSPGLEKRFKTVFLFTVMSIIGFFLIDGWWLLHLYHEFGNPLFPFYTKYFPSEWIGVQGNLRTGFGPENLFQTFVWPFFITLYPMDCRVGNEIGLHAYVLASFFAVFACVGLIFLLNFLVRKWGKRELCFFEQSRNLCYRPSVFLLLWMIFGFAFWMGNFNIFRYLLPVDSLAPLGILILVSFLFSGEAVLFIVCCGVGVILALNYWKDYNRSWFGYVEIRTPFLKVDVPELSAPEKTQVLMFRPSCRYSWATNSWLIPFFPSQVSFIELQQDANQTENICPGRAGTRFFPWTSVPFKKDFYDYVRKSVSLKKSYILIGDLSNFNHSGFREYKDDFKKMKLNAKHFLEAQQIVADISQCRLYHTSIGNKEGYYSLCPISLKDKIKK